MNARQAAFDFPELDLATQQLPDYISSCRAQSTSRAYEHDWNCFRQWCGAREHEVLPANPDTVAEYLTRMARLYKPITLGRGLAAISVEHQTAGFSSPTTNILVRNTLSGIRRHHSVAPTRKTPIRASNLHRAVEALPDDMKGLRDKALLLLGYVGALRRSELVAINAEDIGFVDRGIRLTLRRSKTDQEGRGSTVGIGYGVHSPTCPVKALKSWLEAAGINEGPVFRSVSHYGRVGKTRLHDRTVALIVKGLDAAPLWEIWTS